MKTVGLIQAHHASWEGGKDFSLAHIGSKTAVEHVLERLSSMSDISAVVIAVPNVPENDVYKEIAAKYGATCFFGSKENVLDRCVGAIDSVGGEEVVHVMGQHCFIDIALLGQMLRYMRVNKYDYVSMPDSFTPYFSGKVYTRYMLNTIDTVLHSVEDSAIHRARFAAFVESNRERFNTGTFMELPHYSDESLLEMRKAAEEMFADDRLHVSLENASTVSSPLLESYDFSKTYMKSDDNVLDIACGDGFGCRRIFSAVSHVTGIDINATLVADNNSENKELKITYDIGDACTLPYSNDSFSTVTAMEIIEHIPINQVDAFVGEIRRVLKPGGMFFCSTPQNSMGAIPVVPWHVKEYSLDEFKAVLGKQFSNIKVYGAKSGGPLTEDEYGQKMLSICQ
jgi:spore coat polysaccharide biosynthesis protein SpsF (cytidylyltransferase family)